MVRAIASAPATKCCGELLGAAGLDGCEPVVDEGLLGDFGDPLGAGVAGVPVTDVPDGCGVLGSPLALELLDLGDGTEDGECRVSEGCEGGALLGGTLVAPEPDVGESAGLEPYPLEPELPAAGTTFPLHAVTNVRPPAVMIMRRGNRPLMRSMNE